MAKWKQLPEIAKSDVARPDFERWFTGIVNEVANYNENIRDVLRSKYDDMLSAAIMVYGENSDVVRYLKRKKSPSPPSTRTKTDEAWKMRATYQRAEARRIKAAEKADQEREQRELDARISEMHAKEYRSRREQAALDLEKRGLIRGEDFHIGNAITVLRRLEREDSARMIELEHEYRNYDG